MLIGILAIIAVFGLIVVVHEWGHMMAAKLCGVAVPDFAIGMGPSLASIKRGETRYHICAFPIGGFVRIAGMEGDDPVNDRARNRMDDAAIPYSATWQSKNGWQKTFILVAGALMNLVLAFVVILVMGLVGFPHNAVVIASVSPDSPAAEAGLLAGDHVLELAGKQITNNHQFSALVQAHRGQTVPLSVMRSGERVELSVTPRVMSGYNANKVSLGVGLGEVLYSTTTVSLVQPKSLGMDLGIKIGDRVTEVNGQPVDNGWDVYTALANIDADLNPIDADGNPIPAGGGTPVNIYVERGTETLSFTLPGDTTFVTLGLQFKPLLEKLPLGASIKRSLNEAYNMLVGTLYSLRLIFTRAGMQSVTGPVGIAQIIAQSSQSDWYTFLQMVVMISTIIGLFNLMPLPALDGGRLVFVALGGIGLRVSERREALVHAVGMFVLLGLMGLVTFTDILALF